MIEEGDIVEVAGIPNMIGVVNHVYPQSIEVSLDNGVIMECSYDYLRVLLKSPFRSGWHGVE